MEWILASLATLTAALVCAVFLLARRQQLLEARQRELLLRLEQLQSAIAEQRRQIDSRGASTSAAPTKCDHQLHDTLSLIEQLSDVGALHDDLSLKKVANQVSELPPGISPDLFESDHKLLAISRLLNQGNSLPEVAARLNLPLGEVELLANTRS